MYSLSHVKETNQPPTHTPATQPVSLGEENSCQDCSLQLRLAAATTQALPIHYNTVYSQYIQWMWEMGEGQSNGWGRYE